MAFVSDNIASSKDLEQSEPVLPVARDTTYRRAGKRVLDCALVLGALPFVVIVIGVLVLAVLATGQAPFYVQKRIGRGGKVFKMYKLRTMLPNADQRLETYLNANPKARAEWDSKQKLRNDPRVTPIGNFLRKSSLDELPQLLNVLNGTMSLVGPRPIMVEQDEQYSGTAYYQLRPGMTGLWQVSDRNDCAFVGRVHFDETYDHELSLKTDLKILLKTVSVVFRGTGL